MKVLLPTHLPTFWRNLEEGARLGVEFDVEHRGVLYNIAAQESDSLSLVSHDGTRRLQLAHSENNTLAVSFAVA